MDLFGPSAVWSHEGNRYTLVIVDDYSKVILGKTPYELLRGRKPTLDYFRVFGSKCFILKTKEYHTKFDSKSYEDVFLEYSQNSKAYIILNKHTRKVEESLNVTFDETPPPSKTSPLVDDDLDEEEAIRETEKKNLENIVEDETLKIDEIVNIKESRNHPLENVLGNLNQRTLRSQAQNQSNFFCFISTIEPKNVNEALGDECDNHDLSRSANGYWNMGQDKPDEDDKGVTTQRSGFILLGILYSSDQGENGYVLILRSVVRLLHKGRSRNPIQAEEFDFDGCSAADLDGNKEVNAKCILMANL
ncbi:retrovirus-related pol polyprotein from transposon TNT 1-94 [Tanacetum coccineum]